jgi:hypothetical protein
VTKFLVYNARKRQEGGDRAATYFLRTECVAGVQVLFASATHLRGTLQHAIGMRHRHEALACGCRKRAELVR